MVITMKAECFTNSKRNVINDFLVSLKVLSKASFSVIRCMDNK